MARWRDGEIWGQQLQGDEMSNVVHWPAARVSLSLAWILGGGRGISRAVAIGRWAESE